MRYRHAETVDGLFRSAIRGLALDSHGLLYAAGDFEIRWDRPPGLSRFSTRPTSRPAHSVAVAPDASIYVGEESRIEIFSPDGKLLRVWTNLGIPGPITAIGFLQDSILAADAAARSIRRYDLSGRLLNTIGADNPVNGFLIPNGVLSFAVDGRGVIHAANPGKHRVERYSAEGKLLGHIGRFDGNDPAGFTGCCNPTNIAVTDRIYVTEKAVPRAKVYDFAGNLLAVIADAIFDPNVKNMSVAAAADGRVYVVDTVKLSILAFEPVAS